MKALSLVGVKRYIFIVSFMTNWLTLQKTIVDLAYLYEKIFNLKATLTGLLLTRLILVCKLNTRIEIIVNTFEKVSKLNKF